PATARWLLSMAYQHLGLKDAASDVLGPLNNTLVSTIPTYAHQGYTYGSEVRDRSLLLLALIRSNEGKGELAWQLAEAIATELSSDAWYSTQSTAWALLAMSEFADATKAGAEAMQFSLRETDSAPWQNIEATHSLY